MYQDFAGRVLDVLETDEKISRTKIRTIETPLLYFHAPDTMPSDAAKSEISERVARFLQVLKSSKRSTFLAELVHYIAMCKVVEEMREASLVVDALPKGQYPTMLRDPWEVDAMLLMRGEYFPADVYNGTHYTMSDDTKVQTAAKVHTRGHANPVLLSRLSSKDVKNSYFRMNGIVVDQGKILTLETEEDDFQDLARELRVHNVILKVPPVTVDGHRLDGDSYNTLLRREERGVRLLDVVNFASAADQIPDAILRKVRGALRLLYVGAEYRLARNATGRTAALILQRVLNRLLTHPDGIDTAQLTDRDSGTFRRVISGLPQTQKDKAVSAFERSFSELEEIGFLRTHGSKVVSDEADHPHTYLNFRAV